MTTDAHKVVTLTTDFGQYDGFAACVKGVIFSYAPNATICDITHEIKPFDVPSAAWIIHNTYRFFPKGTINVVVIDPGVGTSRRPLLLTSSEFSFIGPDNGVFSFVLNDGDVWQAFVLNKPEFYLQEPSATFHGRDIFAPIAGHLAQGVMPAKLGSEIALDSLVKLEVSHAVVEGNSVTGQVVYVDRFGNLITNIDATKVKLGSQVSVDNKPVGTIAITYASGKIGQLVCLIGSHSNLEIGVNKGRGDLALGVGIGAQVIVEN